MFLLASSAVESVMKFLRGSGMRDADTRLYRLSFGKSSPKGSAETSEREKSRGESRRTPGHSIDLKGKGLMIYSVAQVKVLLRIPVTL